MMTVKEISSRLGLTEWQTRRLLYALSEPLQPFRKGGQGRVTLIDPAAIGLLERAAQLHRGGVTLQDLSKAIANELRQPAQNGHSPQLQESASSEQKAATAELIAELRARLEDAQERIRSLERDKSYLQDKLDEALARIPALPPPSSNGTDGPKLSRWQALKLALFGGSKSPLGSRE